MPAEIRPVGLNADNSAAVMVFGSQLSKLVERHHDFTKNPFRVSQMFDDLKGHEMGMIKALGGAVVERMDTLRRYGADGIAREIIVAEKDRLGREEAQAREKLMIKLAEGIKNETIEEHMAREGDY